MGTRPRLRPQRLGEKLLAIRNALGLSQSQMVKRLDVEGIVASQISEFETGKREPSLIVVLQYARLAGVCADVLIDDKLDLPAKLPAKPKRS
ncbi:MAG TPA: helix-turn-helix transcriptional regulator [Pyrinomonadaceae bacterium]|jgi:transcriptional regulator with XRE-family HTH domain